MTATAGAVRARRPRPLAPIWVVIGVVGWIGLAWIATTMAARDARTSGFDLKLILEAGRAVASGQSPYDPGMLAGTAPDAPDLFFSYPPHVAQAASLLSGVSVTVVLFGLWLVAAAGLALVAGRLRLRLAPDLARPAMVLPVLALSPLFLPFGVGLLFGNLDVLFPFAYGLVVLAALGDRRDQVAGGVALALASVTKLHPGSMGVWFLARAARERRQGGVAPAWRVVIAAVVTAVGVLVISVATFGTQIWSDYLTIVRVGAGSGLVDPRNIGPAAQLASVLGLGDAGARPIQVVTTLAALALSAWAGWTRDDPLEGIAWAVVASLATLPVTWYHYPAACLPLAIAALLRARGTPAFRSTLGFVAAAGVVAALALVVLPVLWVAVGLLIVAVRRSVAGTSGRSDRGVGVA